MSSTPEEKTSFWRAIRFPLIVLLLFGGIFAVPWILLAFEVETEGALPLIMFSQWTGPPLALLIIGLWWLLFSGFTWVTRLAGVALVGLLAAGATVAWNYSVRSVELTTGPIGLMPRIHFIWEYSPEDALGSDLLPCVCKVEDLNKIDATVGPDDFPNYRGPKFDGVISHAKLQTDWDKYPPTVQWQKPCPGGYGGVAVAGKIAVTLQQRRKQEVVVCYDRYTGQQLWAYAYDAFHQDVMGNGPRSTPTIHNKMIFTIGATGEMLCLNAEGVKQWSTNILTDGSAVKIKWGMTGSPLIVDDLVIANAGIDPENPTASSLIAYEQTTGKIRWRTGSRRAGYSSPQIVTLNGTPQILLFDGAGLVSYDKAGKELWQHPWFTDFEMNSIQPVVIGSDRVFISSELKNGCALLRITADSDKKWSVETVWANKNLAARYANPVTNGKHIFGLHNMNGLLICLNVSDGKVAWKGDRFEPGQLLLTDGVLIVTHGKTGDVTLFKTDAENEVLARHQTFEKDDRDKTWNTPSLAGDQLFIRNQAKIVCLKLQLR